MFPISWFVYVLECRDKTLYTGVTNDIERRIGEHQQGVGSKYTRGRTPVILLACKELSNRSEAQALEHRIKKMDRQGKMQMIARWQDNEIQ